MVFVGYQIWKLFRSNQIVLIQEAIRFKHSIVYLHIQRWLSSHSSHSPTTLYMNQKYLRVVKLAHRSGDSKAVVDRATKRPLGDVLDALRQLDETNLDEIKVISLISHIYKYRVFFFLFGCAYSYFFNSN